MRMTPLKRLLPHVLPQVLPCPSSMALDALQFMAVDFCTQTEVWSERFQEPLAAGDAVLCLSAPGEAVIVRVRALWLDGSELSSSAYSSEGDVVRLEAPATRSLTATAEAVLRPSRMAENIPQEIFEEWGDIIAYGALAKLKAMSGRHVEWADAQGAGLALQAYNEGVARARGRVLRRRYGNGRGTLRLGGFQEVL